MALDKLVDSTQLDARLTSIANAIRTKGGTSARLSFPQGFVDAITAINTQEKNVQSIAAVFTQGYNLIRNTDNLDVLRQFLEVTAYYDDETNAEVTNYVLVGELTVGTSTITVVYGGKTATFEVDVVDSTVLFSLKNKAMTTDDVINTGVDIISEDVSFSVCVDVALSEKNGAYKIFHQYENASPWRSILLGAGGGDKMSLRYIDKFGNVGNDASNMTRLRVVVTHTKGSRNCTLYHRVDAATTTTTATVTQSFVALTPGSSLRIGKHTAANNWAGTVNNFKVYNIALTQAQAESFIVGN